MPQANNPWPKPLKDLLRTLWGSPGMTSLKIAALLNEHPAADRIFTKNAVIGEAHREDLRQLSPTPQRKKPAESRRSPTYGSAIPAPLAPLTMEDSPVVVVRPPADPAPPEVTAQAPEPALEPDPTPTPEPTPPPPPMGELEAPPPTEVVKRKRVTASNPRPASNVVRLPTRRHKPPVVIKPDLLWFDRLSAKFDSIAFSPGHGRCQFPIGEPRKPGFHFCGARAATAVYCREHDRLCHGFRAG